MRSALVERDWPDVILFDEGVVDGDLTDVLERLLAVHGSVAARVVVTSDSEDAVRAYECVRAGASAFVGKGDGIDELVTTLFAVVAGESRIAPALLSEVLDRFRRAPAAPTAEARPFPRLTAREREVLECLTAGLDRHHIARRLGVSVHTVRTHAQSMFAKLEVHSSVEAVSVATRGSARQPLTGR